MPLIIEDGTAKPDSQTYVTNAEATAFAAARGTVLPADEASLNVLVVRAMDWLESLYAEYQGTRATSTQALQWPRKDVELYGEPFPSNAIPKELKNAQCQVIMDLFAGIDPQANYDATPAVIKEKVDVLETTYAEATRDSVPYLRKATDFLNPLFGSSPVSSSFFAVRV